MTAAVFHIQEIVTGASLEELETYVKRGLRWLNELEKPLKKHGMASNEAEAWINQINRIKGYAARTKTVIGVVGNTGAGKSSVVHAMLDEEQLLPTNTMRAYTAVVTELSYNHEPGRAYRAEVGFINEESWHYQRELSERRGSTLFCFDQETRLESDRYGVHPSSAYEIWITIKAGRGA